MKKKKQRPRLRPRLAKTPLPICPTCGSQVDSLVGEVDDDIVVSTLASQDVMSVPGQVTYRLQPCNHTVKTIEMSVNEDGETTVYRYDTGRQPVVMTPELEEIRKALGL